MRIRSLFFIFFVCAAFVPAARAATLIVAGDGQLTGATGVDVDGVLYDVAFRDGTCIDLFDGCDSPDDFAFQRPDGATSLPDDVLAAGNALIEQVLIDGPDGAFDSDPQLTLGCEEGGPSDCQIAIPIDVTIAGATDAVYTALVKNNRGDVSPIDYVIVSWLGVFDRDSDLASTPHFTYALFTLSETGPTPGEVPLPAAAPLMIAGLGALGGGMARRRRKATTAKTCVKSAFRERR